MPSSQNTETIKMLDNALAVLDTLRIGTKKLGVNEIAKICGINPSTTFRILKTLEANGWVFQCGDGRYIAGQKISFVLSSNNLYLALKEVAFYVMDRYTKEHSQAMNLMVRDGQDCYILQQSRTSNLFDYIPPLGSSLPFYACACGKVLMSELPIALADEIIQACDMIPLTPSTITNPEDFWKELRTVAKQGYAFDNKEAAGNSSCIAVPVRDQEGNIMAALSFSGFVGERELSELLAYLPALRSAAEEISAKLFQCRQR